MKDIPQETLDLSETERRPVATQWLAARVLAPVASASDDDWHRWRYAMTLLNIRPLIVDSIFAEHQAWKDARNGRRRLRYAESKTDSDRSDGD